MNTYDNIILKIKHWAKNNDDIRAVLIVGSRANSIDPPDKYSDLDIIFITKNIEFYEKNTEWIKAFGIPIVCFTEPTFTASFEHRVLYESFLDVDIILGDSEKSDNLFNEIFLIIVKRGYRFVIDKDNYEKSLEKKEKPSKTTTINIDDISNEINNYWFHCIWLSKKILRGELWTAVKALNSYFSTRLLYMMEANKKISTNFIDDTWYEGRHMEKWADSLVIKQIQGSFTDYDKQGIIKSLYHHMNFYYKLSSKVANYYGIEYPKIARNKIINWINENLK